MEYKELLEIFARPITLVLLFIAGALHWYLQKQKELALDKQKLDYQKKLDKEQLDYQKKLNTEQLDYQKKIDQDKRLEEQELARAQLNYDNKHNALKATWGLLRYFSKIPSENSVMYTVGKDYHFRPQKAQAFIAAVEKVFFEDAHGLYLLPEVKKPMFNIRDAIDKLAYTTAQKEGEVIIDPEIGKAIYQNRYALNKILRESV